MAIYKIDEVCELIKGNTPIQKAICGEYPLVVTAEDRLTNEDYQFDCKAVCIPLVSSTGHGHASLKRIHYQEGKFALGSILVAVIPKDEKDLKAEYLYVYLSYMKDLILVPLMKGSANVSLTITALKSAEIEIPSIEVQESIIKLSKEMKIDREILNNALEMQLQNVTELRKSILEKAIQGKLVPQDSNDEPASVLLEKIMEEKERLIKAGKIKKEKLSQQISNDEKPYEVPEGWEWVRLGFILHSTDAGKSPDCISSSVSGNEWGVIKTTAIQTNVFLENQNKILPKDFIVMDTYKIHIDDVLITRAGPKNRVGIVCCVDKILKNLILSDKTVRLSLSEDLISHKYITLSLNSDSIRPFIEQKMTGMAESQVNISQNNMKWFPIPIPPLNEQKRIVENVDSLMDLCDELENRIEKSKKYSETLMESIIKNAVAVE